MAGRLSSLQVSCLRCGMWALFLLLTQWGPGGKQTERAQILIWNLTECICWHFQTCLRPKFIMEASLWSTKWKRLGGGWGVETRVLGRVWRLLQHISVAVLLGFGGLHLRAGRQKCPQAIGCFWFFSKQPEGKSTCLNTNIFQITNNYGKVF